MLEFQIFTFNKGLNAFPFFEEYWSNLINISKNHESSIWLKVIHLEITCNDYNIFKENRTLEITHVLPQYLYQMMKYNKDTRQNITQLQKFSSFQCAVSKRHEHSLQPPPTRGLSQPSDKPPKERESSARQFWVRTNHSSWCSWKRGWSSSSSNSQKACISRDHHSNMASSNHHRWPHTR